MILGLVALFVLFVVGSEHERLACEARGGWSTWIGGYPSCLPMPGSKP